MGIWFWLIVFSINWELILFGIPTKPSSFLSGLTSIILLFFVWKDTAFEPNFFKFWTISSLKSIRTSSTTLIIFLSVTLNPSINFDSIFFLSNSLFILGPPPWTIITDRPNLLRILTSKIKLLNTTTISEASQIVAKDYLANRTVKDMEELIGETEDKAIELKEDNG